MSPVIAELYNNYLAASCFHASWTCSCFVPIFKNSCEQSDFYKYWPLSLLPLLDNLVEVLINDELGKHISLRRAFFSDKQYNFRFSRSTSDVLKVNVERSINLYIKMVKSGLQLRTLRQALTCRPSSQVENDRGSGQISTNPIFPTEW